MIPTFINITCFHHTKVCQYDFGHNKTIVKNDSSLSTAKHLKTHSKQIVNMQVRIMLIAALAAAAEACSFGSRGI
jgi:hypothetical protein